MKIIVYIVALLMCGCSLIVEVPDIPCWEDAGADAGACIEVYLESEYE